MIDRPLIEKKLAIVADIVRNHLENFLAFVAAVRLYVAASFEAPWQRVARE